MLVFATDLEQVEEVGCCCVDLDCVLIWRRCWIREGCHTEILRTLGGRHMVRSSFADLLATDDSYLDILLDLDASHDCVRMAGGPINSVVASRVKL